MNHDSTGSNTVGNDFPGVVRPHGMVCIYMHVLPYLLFTVSIRTATFM
jgi:hypothetical protein